MENGLIRVSVCGFCHDGNGKFVILKRSKQARDEHEAWEPCAGGLKFGETAEEGMRREIQEEICAKPSSLQFLGYRDVHRVQDGKPTHWVGLDFLAQVDPAEVKIGEPHKCDGLQWVTLEELDVFTEPLHSQFPGFLKKYRSRLV